MPLSAQILALVAAALHVLFFYLESIVFSKPSTWKGFGIGSQEEADHVKPMALNQGFYNLFLAIGIVVGFIRLRSEHSDLEHLSNLVTAVGATGSPADVANAHAAVGQFAGLHHWGAAVVIFALLSMLGAALVLIISTRGRLLRGALIQGLVPAIALLITAVA
ncbi:MAG: DUF1304 domain-containing protein [Solirubrobacteraceae bacterium]|nr:DUF1304 domain-containing protein [Patulibacter sp.]